MKVIEEYPDNLPDLVIATGVEFLKFQAGEVIQQLEWEEAERAEAERALWGPNDEPIDCD